MTAPQTNGSRLTAVLTLVGVLTVGALIAFVVIAVSVDEPAAVLAGLAAFIGPTVGAILAIIRVGTLEGRVDYNTERAEEAQVTAAKAEAKADVAASIASGNTSPHGVPAVRTRPLRPRPKEWGA